MEKITLDVSAIGVALLSLLQLIPEVTALFSLTWIVIRIYETATVQRLLHKRKNDR